MPLARLLPLLATLIALSTAALVARLSVSAWQSDQRAAAGLEAVDHLRLALVAAEMVSRERGPTNGLLGEALPPRPERVQALREARDRTDRACAALAAVLPAIAPGAARREAAASLASTRLALARARSRVDAMAALPLDQRTAQALRETVAGMVALVPMLAPTVGTLADEAQRAYPALSDDVQGARLTAELREYAGLLGSQFTAALTRRRAFTTDERLAIERTRSRIDELRFLVALHVQVPGQSREVERGWREVDEHYFQVASKLVERVIAAGEAGSGDADYGMDPAGFAALYVPDMNVMFGLRDELLAQAAARAAGERARSTELLTQVAVVSLLLVLVLAGTMVLVHRRVLRPLAATTLALKALARGERDAPLPTVVVQDEMAAVIGAVRTLQAQTREREALEQERDGLIERLREQSNSDFLTGLPNRRAFFAAAGREISLARRHGHGLVAILFDIDNFKDFNDRLGHAAGDRALTDVAQAVRREMRMGDVVGRHGGEEFVLLLVHCDRDAGLHFAERLRAAIARTPVACPDGSVAHVTASLGVADSALHGLNLETLLSQADAAMYRAKQGGRNRVVVADGEQPPHDRPFMAPVTNRTHGND